MQYQCLMSTIFMILFSGNIALPIRRLKVHKQFFEDVIRTGTFTFTDFKYKVENVNNDLDCIALCLSSFCNNVNYVKDLNVCLLGINVYNRGLQHPPMKEYFKSTTYYDLPPEVSSPLPQYSDHGKALGSCGMNAFGYEETTNGLWPPPENRKKRIVGGFESRPCNAPFVGIMTKFSKPLCTAILVSKNPSDKSTSWGLVAAHCIYNNPTNYRGSTSEEDNDEDNMIEALSGIGFLFGIHDVRVATPHIIYRTATRVFLHPDKDVRTRDVALIKFHKQVKFNQYINGICLPDLHEEINLHSTAQCFTCGWGATAVKDPPREASDVLQCVQMDTMVKNQDLHTRSLLRIRPGQTASKGPYHGDHCSSPNRIFLYGLITGGNGVTLGTIISAARIPYYMSWINGVMRRRASTDENMNQAQCCP